MKQFLIKMFSDKSDINPKTFVGFVSFVTMIIYGVTDVVTGATIGTDDTGSETDLVSCSIFEACNLRVSICFCVVSKILDSTIASYNLIPFT